MALVDIGSNGVEVRFEDSEQHLLPKISPFLIVVLGGRQDGDLFVLGKSDPARVLQATIEFFDKQGIETELGSSAADLLGSLTAANEMFSSAADAGEANVVPASLDLGDFVRTLTPHQRACVSHLLAVQHGANFSVPGAGKTSIAYAVFAALKRQREVERLLVIAPRAAFQPWEEEFEACFGHAPVGARLTGPRTDRDRVYALPEDRELFLITYQMTVNDIEGLRGFCRREKVMVILDESHYVKRIEEGQWASAVLALAPYAKRRLVLTGTPMPQGCEDLWTQFTFLWPGRQILGDKAHYRRDCERGDLTQVKERVTPFFRRITKQDLDLPPLVIERLEVPMAEHQQRIYSAIAAKILAETNLDPGDYYALRLWRRARLIRLLQAASNPSLLGDYSEEFDLAAEDATDANVVEVARRYHEIELPGKFQAATRLTHQLVADGRKVVVWTTFVKNIRMFRTLVGETAPTFIVYGAVPKDYSEDEEFNREQQISGFKTAEGPAVLIANPAACGESISLHHACTDAIYLDRSFDCAKYLQSQDRIHRLGLPANADVRIRILLAGGTIDEVVDHRLEEKADRMNYLLGDDLPLGRFEDVDESAQEEARDYDATIADLKSRLAPN